MNVFALGQNYCEIVPYVEIISASAEALPQFDRQRFLIKSLMPQEEGEFLKAASTRILEGNPINKYTFITIAGSLLKETPWAIDSWHDIGLLPTGVAVFADPGHIIQDGADLKYGSENHQRALGQVFKNQGAIRLPPQLQYVRQDGQGRFHAIAYDSVFPQKPPTTLVPGDSPSIG